MKTKVDFFFFLSKMKLIDWKIAINPFFFFFYLIFLSDFNLIGNIRRINGYKEVIQLK